jgi:hypothetical protein
VNDATSPCDSLNVNSFFDLTLGDTYIAVSSLRTQARGAVPDHERLVKNAARYGGSGFLQTISKPAITQLLLNRGGGTQVATPKWTEGKALNALIAPTRIMRRAERSAFC